MIRIILLFTVLTTLTLLWLTGAGLYVHYRIGWENFLSLNPSDIAIYICSVISPVAVIWLIAGFIQHVIASKKQNLLTSSLLNQSRRASEHTEALVKVMIEIQDQTRSGVLLHNITVAINNMNEIISQIAMRFGILTNDANERLWEKAGNGNLWAFSRVIIDNAERTPNFKKSLIKQAQKDSILAMAIIEFSSRFERLKLLLSKHDHEKILAGIIEEGALGKVFAIIEPVKNHLLEPNPLFREPEAYEQLRDKTLSNKPLETENFDSPTLENKPNYTLFSDNEDKTLVNEPSFTNTPADSKPIPFFSADEKSSINNGKEPTPSFYNYPVVSNPLKNIDTKMTESQPFIKTMLDETKPVSQEPAFFINRSEPERRVAPEIKAEAKNLKISPNINYPATPTGLSENKDYLSFPFATWANSDDSEKTLKEENS